MDRCNGIPSPFVARSGRLLPLPQLAPGVKLGLANIVTLVALEIFLGRALSILILRLSRGSFGGGASGVLLPCRRHLVSWACPCSCDTKEVSLASRPLVWQLPAQCGPTMHSGTSGRDLQHNRHFPILAISALVTGFYRGSC